jgi:DNA-binding transcriptional LysR family regulator
MTARRPTALDDLPALALLLDVVDAGSFSRAAKKHGLTTSAVSKRIAQLEARLGMAVLVRTTRRISPTDAGRRLLARAERVLGELGDAEEELHELSRAPRGTLRVATSVGLGQSLVGRLAAEFVARHPEVTIAVSADEELVDLVAGQFDMAVRCGSIERSSLVVRKLTASKRILCASPAYLAEHGEPARLADLERHRCLRHELDAGGGVWKLWADGGEKAVTVRPVGGFYSDNPFVLREAVVAGAGIAFLPDFIVADDLRSGRVSRVLGEFSADRGWIYLAFPSARISKLARAFGDFVASNYQRPVAMPPSTGRTTPVTKGAPAR